MKFSNNLRWFVQVWWERKSQYVDCLVDKAIEAGDEGFFVIADGLGLKVISAEELNQLERFCVVGKAERFVYSF